MKVDVLRVLRIFFVVVLIRYLVYLQLYIERSNGAALDANAYRNDTNEEANAIEDERASADDAYAETLHAFDVFRKHKRLAIIIDTDRKFWRLMFNVICTLNRIDPKLVSEHLIVYAHDEETAELFRRLGIRVYFPQAIVALAKVFTHGIMDCFESLDRPNMQAIMIAREFAMARLLQSNVSIVRFDADICFIRDPRELERGGAQFVPLQVEEDGGMGRRFWPLRSSKERVNYMIMWAGYWRATRDVARLMQFWESNYLWPSFRDCENRRRWGKVQYASATCLADAKLVLDDEADDFGCRNAVLQMFNVTSRVCPWKLTGTINATYKYLPDPRVHYINHAAGGSFASKVVHLKAMRGCYLLREPSAIDWSSSDLSAQLASVKDARDLCVS